MNDSTADRPASESKPANKLNPFGHSSAELPEEDDLPAPPSPAAGGSGEASDAGGP